MRLTRDLKLKFSVETESNGVVHICSLQLAREVFEVFYAELGDTFARLTQLGDAKTIAMTAPQLAYPALKASANLRGTWDTKDGVQNGLMRELSRLTMVAYSTPEGWKEVPMDTAVQREILDKEAEQEVLGVLVFTSAVCKAAPKELAGDLMEMSSIPRNWLFSASTFSEYLSSLQESTPVENTTAKLSSVIA